MPARVVKLQKPKGMKITRMTCDEIIHPRLTRQGPMVLDCFANTFFCLILGRPGQGKTSLAISLMRYILCNCFHYVYLIMPPESRTDIDPRDNIFEELDRNQVFDDLTVENLDTIYDEMCVSKANGHYSLVLLDDFQNQMKDKLIAKALERFIIKMRHTYGSLIFLQQNFGKLHKKSRGMATTVISYNSGKQELEALFEEIFKRKKEQYRELMQVGFHGKHDWIAINTISGKVYKEFDLIEFDDDDDHHHDHDDKDDAAGKFLSKVISSK